jgi:Fe-S oxidoreductase
MDSAKSHLVEPDACQLCERKGQKLTRHHLIPKTRHRNKKNRKLFDREEVKTRILWVCRSCHNTLHALFTEKELERTYNTAEALKAVPEVENYLKWVADKPSTASYAVRSRKR